MSLSLIRLLTLASFCAMVFGAAVNPNTDRVSRRQASRFNIVKRSATKAMLQDLSARIPTAVRRQDTQVSAVPVPNCAAALGLEAGYAHYANWDLPGRSEDRPEVDLDLFLRSAASERECQENCDVYADEDERMCVANFFCALKSSAYPYTAAGFTTQNGPAMSAGAATDMRGTCAFWRQYVPAAMDAVCCQT